jgi:FkbM family methyltransferase
MIDRLIAVGQRLLGNTRLGRALARAGLVSRLRRGRDRRILAAGVYEKEWAGRTLRFRVTTRTEIARVDSAWREQALIERMVASLQPGDSFLDVGANIGVVSILVAGAVGPEVTVHALEPEPENCRALAENIAANGLDQVSAHEVALGAASGPGVLHVAGESGTGSHSLVGGDRSGSTEIPIEVVRGDAFVSTLDRTPAVVKIDVEGAELDVLRGLEGTLATSDLRDVFVEVHPGLLSGGQQPSDVDRLLDAGGLRRVGSEVRGDEIHVHYRREQPPDP